MTESAAQLGWAYARFEEILYLLRAGEDRAGHLLPAFVLAAAAAADGRDAVASAGSFRGPGAAGTPAPAAAADLIADQAARLSRTVGTELRRFVPASAGDEQACADAVGRAWSIYRLLARPQPG